MSSGLKYTKKAQYKIREFTQQFIELIRRGGVMSYSDLLLQMVLKQMELKKNPKDKSIRELHRSLLALDKRRGEDSGSPVKGYQLEAMLLTPDNIEEEIKRLKL